MDTAIVVLRADDAERLAAMDAAEHAVGQGGEAWANRLRAGHVMGLGVETDQGALVAYLIVSLTPDFVDIEDVLVAPYARRQGLATRLIKSLAERAGERGIARMGLDVAEDNIAASRLYEGLGFAVDRVRPRYYRSGASALVMSRSVAGLAGLGLGVGPSSEV
ncbi:MAG: GNAT family N-acetyltransferase [Pseudomonadota bacterium]